MKPYYEQDGIAIYNGDCRVVLEPWEASRQGKSSFDLLLTDPPYGIGEAAGRNASRGCITKAQDFGSATWDDGTADEAVTLARSLCRHQIIFGGNYYSLPPSSCWLVWDKDNGATDFADCELAWTNFNRAVRRLRYRWQGMLQQPGRKKEQREHPTQKPEPVMLWALGLAPQNVTTVLDPFMGSGTTLVAAKRMGKKAIGIELEERYCEIAVRRLCQSALPLSIDTP